MMKKIYDICISSINIMKPLTCIEIFKKYGSNKVLNFCSGWGGSAVACAALNLNNYIGIEINKSLEEPYKNMTNFLSEYCDTSFNMIFEDCLNVDYSVLDYDTVFCSPPYYFIENMKIMSSIRRKKR